MFFAFIANEIVILTMFACHTDYSIEGAYTKRLSKMYHGTSRFLYHLKQHYSQTSNLPKSAKMGNKIVKIGCFAILSERLRHYMRRCFR